MERCGSWQSVMLILILDGDSIWLNYTNKLDRLSQATNKVAWTETFEEIAVIRSSFVHCLEEISVIITTYHFCSMLLLSSSCCCCCHWKCVTHWTHSLVKTCQSMLMCNNNQYWLCKQTTPALSPGHRPVEKYYSMSSQIWHIWDC